MERWIESEQFQFTSDYYYFENEMKIQNENRLAVPFWNNICDIVFLLFIFKF